MGKSRQPSALPGHTTSDRLREVRLLRYGERGKSAFARDLKIPVTSYVHYEAGRSPPADILVSAARITNVRLEWLLTGIGDREAPSLSEPSGAASPLPSRLKELLGRRPQLGSTVEEFLKLLDQSDQPATSRARPAKRRSEEMALIPVVGSTAAGVARFWSESKGSALGPIADSRLEKVLAQHAERSEQPCSTSTTATPGGGVERVSLVQYSTPDEEGFLEFLSAARLKQQHPRAVAWRIDGESMAPRYRDGDFVITSPDAPALSMHPCVARQTGQIGVNCKLYQTEGKDVLLIPINEACPTQRIPQSKIEWAWRVLASVRLQ